MGRSSIPTFVLDDIGQPFEWRPGDSAAKEVRFFDEGAEPQIHVFDLIGFEYDEDRACGSIDRMVRVCRGVLREVNPQEARAMLWLGDFLLGAMLDTGKLHIANNDREIEARDVDFGRLDQLDFLHVVVDMLSSAKFVVGTVEVTPARFCAAYVLRMLFNATRGDVGPDLDLPEAYVVSASQVFGVMQSFSSPEGSPLSRVVAAELRRIIAKNAAHAMHQKDPRQAAKDESFKLWQERHAGKHPKLRTNEQFAAECMRRWPVLTNAKVILGWCTEWNKQVKRKSQPAS